VTDKQRAQYFDENAALAELERLRASIEAARHARQQKSDEFDAFVAGFRNPAATPVTERPLAAPPSVDTHYSEWESESDEAPDANPLPSSAPPIYHEPAEETAPAQRPARPGQLRNAGLVAGAAVVGLVVIGVVSSRWRTPASPGTTANPVATPPVSPTQSAPPPASAPTEAAAPASAPAPDAAVGVDLKIVRPVWMRIVVDGRKQTEGMVQPTESLKLTADHSIVVRTGNGGDVRVKTGGREQPFGEADQPLTRTFLKR
jgi:hypothetical protein